MRVQGIEDMSATSKPELDSGLTSSKRGDGGRAFLWIMRGFERTRAKRQLYVDTLRDVPYPVQAVWGEKDPALRIDREGEAVRRIAGLDQIHTVPAKHFLQEDQAPAVAERIAALAGSAA